MKRSTKAIILSMFAVVGLSGIGHFYLKRFKEGIIFLVSGLIAIVTIELYLMDGSIFDETFTFNSSESGDIAVSLVTIIIFISAVIRIMQITKEKK